MIFKQKKGVLTMNNVLQLIKDKIKSDKALMGPTHALSAVAFALLITWIASDFMFDTVLGSRDIVVFIVAIILIVGSSLMPDLDAVNSTSINTLGAVGSILSKMMRAFSSFVQNLIKGPYDKVSDPHRGFWHTLLAAFLVGAFASSLASIDVELFTFRGSSFTVSYLIVLLFVYISIHLTLVSLFKKVYKKSKSGFAEKIITNMIVLALAILLITLLPSGLSYSWVGGVITFGWIAHLLGDMMTVSGVPILFPLKFKGKRWWDFRIPLAIKAGGPIEKTVLIPIFTIIIIISLYNIVLMFL